METLEVADGKSSVMGHGREGPGRWFFIAQVVLRFLTIGFTAAGIAIMVTAAETAHFEWLSLTARYSYLSAFKYLVGANAVICGFCLLSLVSVSVLNNRGSNHYLLVFFHDLILMVLSMSACSAGIAIGYVGRYGQTEAGWSAVCGYVKMFCNKVLASLFLSLLAFICLFLLTIMAATKLRVPSY